MATAEKPAQKCTRHENEKRTAQYRTQLQESSKASRTKTFSRRGTLHLDERCDFLVAIACVEALKKAECILNAFACFCIILPAFACKSMLKHAFAALCMFVYELACVCLLEQNLAQMAWRTLARFSQLSVHQFLRNM